jgi:dihydrolipoamide dehydrogenase
MIVVEGREEAHFKSAIIATGSHPVRPPDYGIDSSKSVASTGLLVVVEVPKRLVVLGGGVIGCEFASIFQHFGPNVKIVEFMADLVTNEDPDAIKMLKHSFRNYCIAMSTSIPADTPR